MGKTIWYRAKLIWFLVCPYGTLHNLSNGVGLSLLDLIWNWFELHLENSYLFCVAAGIRTAVPSAMNTLPWQLYYCTYDLLDIM